MVNWYVAFRSSARLRLKIKRHVVEQPVNVVVDALRRDAVHPVRDLLLGDAADRLVLVDKQQVRREEQVADGAFAVPARVHRLAVEVGLAEAVEDAGVFIEGDAQPGDQLGRV